MPEGIDPIPNAPEEDNASLLGPEDTDAPDIKPSDSRLYFGIDLGTSNSAIAVTVRGDTRVIPVDGMSSCPSVVHVRPKNGEIVVGREAKNKMIVDPDNTVASVKREMGTDWQQSFEGQPGKVFTPVDIAAAVLDKLREAARMSGIVPGNPVRTVICVPANYEDVKRNVVKEAAALAGFTRVVLLEEPTAAAIAYAADRSADQKILVYDLGGGTFDVTILGVKTDTVNRDFEVLGRAGVPRLGGDDFDAAIMKIAAAQVVAEGGPDILDLKRDQGIAETELRSAQQKLKEVAEEAKKELTEAPTAEMILPNLIKDEQGKVFSLSYTLTREEFEAAIESLILQSKAAVEEALKEAELTMRDVSRIVLVGGSTRVPLVGRMLTEMFGKKPYGDISPDLAVAVGAALYGSSMSTLSDRPPITKHETVSHNLGVELIGQRFDILIPKGTKIPDDAPLTTEKTYTNPEDDQEEVAIKVYQYMDEPTHVEPGGFQGEFVVGGVPKGPMGTQEISVTFEISQDNTLKVTAKTAGATGSHEIKREA